MLCFAADSHADMVTFGSGHVGYLAGGRHDRPGVATMLDQEWLVTYAHEDHEHWQIGQTVEVGGSHVQSFLGVCA